LSREARPSWKFVSPELGCKVSAYALTEKEAREALLGIVNPAIYKMFRLESVETRLRR